MMMKNWTILGLALLLAGMTTGQTVTPPAGIGSGAEYDAWKAQMAAGVQPIPPAHPGETEEDASRDGEIATCDCWVAPDATYYTINNATEWNAAGWGNGDDGSYGPVALPFSFYLYGQYYTQCYININGSISFGGPEGTYNASGFPASGFSLVAPFWADVDLRGGNSTQNKVQYKVMHDALYVNWTNVGYYPMQTDKVNSFQVHIKSGDPGVDQKPNVTFCYGSMQWTTGSASGGSNGFGGTPANVGANKGDNVNYIQFGRFNHAGTDYNGPFGAPSGVGWLTGKSFSFATDITVGNLVPVVAGQSVCDSLTVCTGVLTQLSMEFLSPEPNQITVPNSTAPTLSNYTIVNNVTGNVGSITTEFLPTLADTGYHVITFTGTDNGSPVMTGTQIIILHVVSSPQLVSDTLAVCDNGAPVDMLDVLGGATPGGDWVGPNNNPHSGIFDPTVDPEGVYHYAISIGGQCSATGTATMEKVAHADAGGNVNAAFCSWDLPEPLFPLLAGSPQTGGTWLTPGGAAFPGTLDPSIAAAGVYNYVVYGDAPCPNDTAFITVAIPQAVDAGINNSITMCRDAAPFSMRGKLGGTPDATGQWTNVLGNPVSDSFDPTTGDIGVYTYTVPAVLPCPDQAATLTINMDPLPSSGQDSSLTVCANDNDVQLFFLLGNNPDQGGHWLDPLGGPLEFGLLNPATAVNGSYRYVTIGPGTCSHLSDTAVVTVQVNPLPVITFTADPDSGCAPLEVTFTNTTDPMYVGPSCVWNFGDGTEPVEACGSVTHVYEESGWYHIKLRVTTPEGCTDQLIAPGTVLVDPAPEATFVYTPNPGTAGNNRLVFTATDPQAVTFQWTLPDGTWPTGQQTAYTFPDKIADTYTVCLHVMDRYGCESSFCDTTITIKVPNLWVPTAFSPDGNNLNDEFKPIMLDMVDEDYRLQIFDRWGQIVFETTDPEKGWDGRAKGGILPTSTYVWRITFRPVNSADQQVRYGVVNLIK